jgi:autophagy-related protein 5
MNKGSGEEPIDADVKRTVWNGTIPVMVSLAVSEVGGTATPRPLFLNVPRCSYFAAKTHETIREHFASSIPASGGEMWLEFNALPLRWHYPVGVLYDLLAESELPWSLVVHFQNFPTEQVMRLGNSSATPVRSYFMNSLKEATYVKQNGIKVINDFGIRESDAIWEGLYDGNYEKFWSTASVTSPSTTANLPIRILRPNFPIMQFPCPTQQTTDQDTPHTLSTALAFCKVPLAPSSSILVHGISPPLETPLPWLYQHFCHPDGFLYIVVKD